MSLVDRAKNILLNPKAEWEVVAKEPATVGGLFTGYAIPLSVLPIFGSVIAMGLLGIGSGSLAPMGIARSALALRRGWLLSALSSA